ncbi:MAG: hypothetical protein QXH71_00025 [Candidatus Anstonellaceae archaeon]
MAKISFDIGIKPKIVFSHYVPPKDLNLNPQLEPNFSRTTYSKQLDEIKEKLNNLDSLLSQPKKNFKSISQTFVDLCKFSNNIKLPKLKKDFLTIVVDIIIPTSDLIFSKLEKIKNYPQEGVDEQTQLKQQKIKENCFESLSFITIINNQVVFEQKLISYLVYSHWLYSQFGDEKTALRADQAFNLIQFYLPLYYKNSIENLKSLESKPFHPQLLYTYFNSFYLEMLNFISLLIQSANFQLKINPKAGYKFLEFAEKFLAQLELVGQSEEGKKYEKLKNEIEKLYSFLLNVKQRYNIELSELKTSQQKEEQLTPTPNLQPKKKINLKDFIKEFSKIALNKIETKLPKYLNFLGKASLGFSLGLFFLDTISLNSYLYLSLSGVGLLLASKLLEDFREKIPLIVPNISKLSVVGGLGGLFLNLPLSQQIIFEIGKFIKFEIKSLYQPLLYPLQYIFSAFSSFVNSTPIFGLPTWSVLLVGGSILWLANLGVNIYLKKKRT